MGVYTTNAIMVNQQLISYIKEQLKNGYDIEAIRNNLLQHGYNRQMVEESIHTAFHKPFPVIPVAVIGAAVIVMLVTFLIFSKPIVPEKLLDIETSNLDDTVEAGKNLNFNVEITNMGSKNAYDVTLEHTLLDSNRNIITSKQESLAVLTKASSKSQIIVPATTPSGKYILETVARYEDQLAKSSFMISVERKTGAATGANNTAITDTGVPPELCPVNCDDLNVCTMDVCNPNDAFICKHSIIEPCCGNKVCEETENYKVCSKDCEAPDVYKSMSKEEIVSQATEKAAENPAAAAAFCREIKDSNNKDECYRAVAEKSSSSFYCDAIASEVRRDMCYGSFATKGDFTVCDKMTNPYMKESCEALKE